MDNGTKIAPEVEEFLRAAKDRDCAKVASCLGTNGDLLNSVEAGGFGALHFAANNGDMPMLELLLSKKPKIDIENYDGNTPLILAAKAKQHDVVRQLIEAGADVNFATKSGATAAHHAATMGHLDTLRFLTSVGAAVNIQKILECGSVLHWAAATGDIQVVGPLIYEFGVPVDVVDAHGGTPLFIAIHSGKSELVTFLLEHGANPNTVITEDGSTPLHVALDQKAEDVKTLLKFGADASKKNKEGKSPADIATEKKLTALAKELNKPLPTKEKKAEDAARFKAQGNKVFMAGENVKAAKFYSLAISLDPSNQVFFSNRAASLFNNRVYVSALYDANRAIALKPDWPKGYFRKAATLHAMGQSAEAEKVIATGLKFDAKNNDLVTLQNEIKKAKK